MAAIFQIIFLETFSCMKIVCNLIEISIKFVPKGPINKKRQNLSAKKW